MTNATGNSARYAALSKATSRTPRKFERFTDSDGKPVPVSNYFGCHVFGVRELEPYLSSKEIQILKGISKNEMTMELADKVAAAVKEWALSNAATHFSHWFQPQTGATAEKHDAFLSFRRDGTPLEKFTGKLLMQQEPDASSFPSGGMRSTFEARGYTAWDSSSPMFLRESLNGLTLCIPSIFVSYSGQSLDKKTPLLRSVAEISKVATESLKLLGHSDVTEVHTTCGPEQEYFVVDKALFNTRPDLVLSGRTLLGGLPPKGQQLDDHYFGIIKPRILNFMMEVEQDLYKMGVPCKTRHNEVAPSQFELAALYEYANVAADHNQLIMEVLKTVAARHDLVVLFHEKPFAEINGSGKHLNWSLEDSNGNNLLDIGDTPKKNVEFLFFLTAVIKAVRERASLLRSSVASAGNDYRLGANEAPPAIMSVFLGSELSSVFSRIESGEGGFGINQDSKIDLDLTRIPVITKDNTDRNRTSPFAFTGNKFEFRALGATQSICYPAAYLNAAVSAALRIMNTELAAEIKTASSTEAAVLNVVKKHYVENKQVCFDGNGYSEEWHNEARERGLPENKTTPEALTILKDPETREFLVQETIYGSEKEIDWRYNVLVDRYVNLRSIETETALQIASTHVIPSGIRALKEFAMTLQSVELAKNSPASKRLKAEFTALEASLDAIITAKDKLMTVFEKSRQLGKDSEAVAKLFASEGVALLEELRVSSASLEARCDDSIWTLPKMQELLYGV